MTICEKTSNQISYSYSRSRPCIYRFLLTLNFAAKFVGNNLLTTLLHNNNNETYQTQGAKKVNRTACHSGKLKLTFTSPNIISTSPKNVLMRRLISQFLCDLDSSKNSTCPSGKLITEFTSPIAKPTSTGLSDTTFFARCKRLIFPSRKQKQYLEWEEPGFPSFHLYNSSPFLCSKEL